MYMSNIFIKSLIYIMIPTSVIIVLSSNNWLAMWIGLELNMLSFIPVMVNSSKFQEFDAMIKYFLIQAMGSSLLLLTTIIMLIYNLPLMTSMLIIASMIMKLGMVPCHMWFPSVMTSISWWSCLILSSIQKLAPLTILMFSLMSSIMLKLMMIISLFNVMVGGTTGMMQTKMKSIMAFSSITHMGWMLSAKTTFMPTTAIMYLAMYSILISPIFMLLNQSNIMYSHQLMDKSSFSTNKMIMLPIMLLSLGGLPPLMGFIPKWMMISLLSVNFMMLIPLILGSMMNLYFYLNILFNSSMYQNHLNMTNMFSTSSTPMLLFSITSIMMLPLMSMTMFMFYAMTMLN